MRKIYLDHAATTPISENALNKMLPFMTEKFAKYSNEQLDAVYETYTCCPSEEATNMHERLINEQMKKEASELAGFVPAIDLKEEVSSDNMEALVLERELASQK